MKRQSLLFVLGFGVALIAPVCASSAADQHPQVKSTPLPATSTRCEASCTRYLHNGNKLSIIVLDEDGSVFKTRTISLPREAKLSYHQPEQSGNTLTLKNGDEITTLTSNSTYTFMTNGATRVVVVVTVQLFLNDGMIDTYIYNYNHKFPIRKEVNNT